MATERHYLCANCERDTPQTEILGAWYCDVCHLPAHEPDEDWTPVAVSCDWCQGTSYVLRTDAMTGAVCQWCGALVRFAEAA